MENGTISMRKIPRSLTGKTVEVETLKTLREIEDVLECMNNVLIKIADTLERKVPKTS